MFLVCKQIAVPPLLFSNGLINPFEEIDRLVDASGTFEPNLRYGQQFAHLIPIKGGTEGAKVHVLLAWGFPFVLKVIRGKDLKKGALQTRPYVKDEILPGIRLAMQEASKIPHRLLATRLHETLRLPAAAIHPMSLQDLLTASPAFVRRSGDQIEVDYAILQEKATPLDILFRRIHEERLRGNLSEGDYLRIHIELMHEMFNAAEALWSVNIHMLNMTVYNMMSRGRTVCIGDFDSFRPFSELHIMNYSEDDLDMWGGERLGGDNDICHRDHFSALIGPFSRHPALQQIYQQVADRVFSQQMMRYFQNTRKPHPLLPRLVVKPAVSESRDAEAPPYVEITEVTEPTRRIIRDNRQFLDIDPGYRKARRLRVVVANDFIDLLDDPDSVEHQLLSEVCLSRLVDTAWDRLAHMGKITLDGSEIARTMNDILWEKLPDPFHVQGFGVLPIGQDAGASEFRLLLGRTKIHPGVPVIGISTQPDSERLFTQRHVTFLDELLIPENATIQLRHIINREAGKGTRLFNVMVVHEDPKMRQRVEVALRVITGPVETLEQNGMPDVRVVPAGDVYEALEVIRERGPFHAVIVKDDTRPGPQGPTLIDLIRGGLTAADTNRIRPQIAREVRMESKLIPDASLDQLLGSSLMTRFVPEALWKTWLNMRPRDASVLGEITRSTGYVTHGRLKGHPLDVVIKFPHTPADDSEQSWTQRFMQMALEMEMLDALHNAVPGLVPFSHGPVVVPNIRHFAFATERVAGYHPDSLFQSGGVHPLIPPHEIISLFARVDPEHIHDVERKLLGSRIWKEGNRFKFLVLNRDQTVYGIPRRAGEIVIVEFIGYSSESQHHPGWGWSMTHEIRAAKARAHLFKAKKLWERVHIRKTDVLSEMEKALISAGGTWEEPQMADLYLAFLEHWGQTIKARQIRRNIRQKLKRRFPNRADKEYLIQITHERSRILMPDLFEEASSGL